MPTGDIKFRENFLGVTEFMQQFTTIPKGSTLYRIKGHQNPNDEEGIHLGAVVTTDKCVTSYFGDTKLFFKHQYISEDMALRPEWAQAYNSY